MACSMPLCFEYALGIIMWGFALLMTTAMLVAAYDKWWRP